MKSIIRVLAVSAAVSGLSAFAQNKIEDIDDDEAAAPAEESKDATVDVGGQIHHAKAETKYFFTLPTVRKLEGSAEVLKPGSSEWTSAEEGRYYPLGTSFRTSGLDTRLTVQLGYECSVVIHGEASFGTREQGLEEKSRAISLMGGVIAVRLPRSLPEGMFIVNAPGFSVVNPAGESIYRYVKTGDGDKATVRCKTGSLAIEGRHFRILSMRAANEVCIQTSEDLLFTGIYGTRGDYICKLDQGLVKVTDVETGESHINPKFLEWKMSPQTAVRIQRAVPTLGKNMSVSVMTFDAAGTLKNRCAFAENRFEINSGELAPSNKSAQADLVKKAAEATSETAAVEATETEASDSGDDSKASSDSDE
jgi:hypothetical protein